MKIVVLGGAGKMGCVSVQALANDSRVDEIVIADINMENAKIVADYLSSSKISIQAVDVNDQANLVGALKGADTCLNATVYYTNLQVMEACLEAGVHYCDMGGLFFLTRKQLELHQRFKDAGISAILGLGSAPGIPNIQARYAADRLDTIESIKIYDGIKPPPPDSTHFSYAVPTIVEELTVEPMVFEDGEFKAKPPLSGFEDYWFIEPLGMLPMHLSLHSEVATLPVSFKEKGVQECFFKINYWGMAKEMIEKVGILVDFGFNSDQPVEVKGQQVVPHDLMMALMGGYVPELVEYMAPPKVQPPDWVKEIVTEINGKKDGKEITYRLGTMTCKGAWPTGAVPAIAAIWLAEGKIDTGVYPPELAINPEPFFRELEEIDVSTRVSATHLV